MKPINIIFSFAGMLAVAIGAGLTMQYVMSLAASPRSDASFCGECILVVGIGFLSLWIVRAIRRNFDTYICAARRAAKSVEDRLDELERLKRRDMVTPEEYAAKRQEILKDL